MFSAAPGAPSPPFSVDLLPGWLVVRFAEDHIVASWAIAGGAFQRTRTIVWHEVRDAELSADLDPTVLLAERLRARGLGDAVGLLTSRTLARFVEGGAATDDVSAHAVATVGLGNALRVGDAPGSPARLGTINVLCRTSEPLAPAAALEAIALVAEARTVALLEARVPSRRSGLPASGTGTDCIAVAWPADGTPARYAGKHTALGHVIGASVLEAVGRGVAGWLEEFA